MPRRYDVYDDTRADGRSQPRNQVARREAEAPVSPFGAMDQWFADMNREMRRDMERAPGFGSMFGELIDRSMNASNSLFNMFDRSMQDASSSGNGTYYFKSYSRSYNSADGSGTRETIIRTKPGADGKPETKRIERYPDGTENVTRTQGFPERNGFEDMWPFGHRERHTQIPPAQVEEIRDSDDEQERHHRRYRRTRRSRAQEPIVEEPMDADDDHRHNHGRNDRAEGPRNWRERARAWRGRA